MIIHASTCDNYYHWNKMMNMYSKSIENVEVSFDAFSGEQ